MANVQLIDITKSFGSFEACRGVNLTIDDGEFVTLLGPSGCGKSTTLNLIAGLESVSGGQILMDGREVNDLTPFERDVAMVFQNYALYPQMSVAENIGFSLRLRRRPKAEIQEKVKAVAELLELGPLLHRLPRELSGGQQQRVALGRAVIREPKVFLFDEPFSNLDAALRVRMRVEIKELHQRLGITSIFVTHDQEEAMSISDRIAIMRAGKIEQFGTPEEVYSRPESAYVAQFIGSPRTDILAGTIERIDDGYGYRVGGAVFAIPDAIGRHLTDLPPGEVHLGIRAEHVLFGSIGTPATVTICQPIGPSTFVTAAWEGGTLTTRLAGIVRFDVGDRVHIHLEPAGVLFFDSSSGARIETGSTGM